MMNRTKRQPSVSLAGGVTSSPSRSGMLAWLMPILLMAPLTMAPKGCDSAVVGDDCPAGQVCEVAGTGGKGSGTGGKGGGATGGSVAGGTSGGGGAQICGGLLGAGCDEGEYCSFPESAQCGAADQTGVCTVKPEACDTSYSAVCGCDDNTYGNACEAAAKGVSVASKGECQATDPGESCGGLTGAGCAKDEYCAFAPDAACGAADQTGICSRKAEACTTQYDPVCGCDGKTYGNSCSASSAGVSVAHPGECAGGGGDEVTCGGLLGLQCAKSQYCKFPEQAQCGAADQTGVCETIPQGCEKSYFPVCGCNGTTYGNACMAAAAGVSVASTGECKPTVTSCGGLLGLGCEKGEYCNFPVETKCGSGDQTGSCNAVPEACTQVYSPVCGCDGKTYGNACQAAAASTSVIASGACEPTEEVCGGLLGKQCEKGSYCFYEEGALCGAADATGVCQPRADICLAYVDPVCGCDGVTYSNDCQAAVAGVSVASKGACKG